MIISLICVGVVFLYINLVPHFIILYTDSLSLERKQKNQEGHNKTQILLWLWIVFLTTFVLFPVDIVGQYQSYNMVYIANYTMMSHHAVNSKINPPVLGNTEGWGRFSYFLTTPLRYINDIVNY